MSIRFIFLGLFVCTLVGLVAFSNWNPVPARVSGFIEADEIRLGSRVGGRVARVFAQEGEPVEPGMVIVELEPFDLLERQKELQLELAAREAEYQKFIAGYREEEIGQAKAKLDQLQARLDLLRTGPRIQEIEAAKGRYAMAQAEKKLADENYERLYKLTQSNASTQQELDAATEGLEAANANLSVRQQELALLEAGSREEEIREAAARVEEARQALQLMQRGYRSEEVAQAKAARDAAQATLDALQRQLDELTIKSPTHGTIEALDLQPGDIVPPNAPVVSILDRSDLWVRAYIPQNRVGAKVGQAVRVSVDSFPDVSFDGEITFVSRQSEFTPSNVQTPEERSKQVFRVKIRVKSDQDLLRPGMMADVWLDQMGERK